MSIKFLLWIFAPTLLALSSIIIRHLLHSQKGVNYLPPLIAIALNFVLFVYVEKMTYGNAGYMMLFAHLFIPIIVFVIWIIMWIIHALLFRRQK